jgi:hypothetical protein
MGNCYNSAVINASIDTVWDTIKDFHTLSWGDLVVSKVDKVGDIAGTKVGAQRILNDAFHETLQSIDNDNYSFTYSIDDGPGPVAKEAVDNYIGTVKLTPITDTNQTFIEWTSRFESDDESTVADFCNPIYAGVLASLKSKF